MRLLTDSNPNNDKYYVFLDEIQKVEKFEDVVNYILKDECEWNEIPKKCQRKPDIYGLCKSNYNENDCSRSLLGCVWANNECVDAHQCSLLSSTACENILSNGLIQGFPFLISQINNNED